MDGYKFLLDVSHWQTFNYELVKQHIDGVIIRFGFGAEADRLCDKHYEGFKDIPCAGYQWFRPDQDVKIQIEQMKIKTDGKNINVFFSDQEQKGVYNVGTSTYSPEFLSEAARAHVEGLKLHGFDVGVYSRATWISQYAKPMYSWMFDYHTWLASWPYATGAVNSTWEYLLAYWAPKLFKPYYTADYPLNHRNAQAWQWSGDKFIVPGVFTNATTPVPRSSDFNFVSDALFERIKAGVVVPPVTPPAIDYPAILQNVYNELSDLEADMVLNAAAAKVVATAEEKALAELRFIKGLCKP